MSAWPFDGDEPEKPDRIGPDPEPSDLVRASPHLMGLWADGWLTKSEIERRAVRAQALKEGLSGIPHHARKAAKDPDYWNGFYASRVNW